MRQRRERRDYVQRHSPKSNGNSRKESPSPGPKKRYSDRGRRSSEDFSEGDSSSSPPTTPSPITGRSASNRLWNGRDVTSAANRRATSSGSGLLVRKTNPGYAFGSSTKRFNDSAASNRYGYDMNKKRPFNKSNSDGVQQSLADVYGDHYGHLAVERTVSDNRSTLSGHSRRGSNKDSVAKAWLQFKEDIESAMQKKPNQGFYKNLSEMMHTKMELLNNEVGNIIKNYIQDTISKHIMLMYT